MRHHTKFYRFDALSSGNQVSGPAIILTPVTTIVIQPGQTADVDSYKNIIIRFGESGS